MLASLARQAAGERRDTKPKDPPQLLPINLLAWDVFIAAFNGRQFAVAPMGGVVGFRYEAVESLLRIQRVPGERWSEVFVKFQILEPFALKAVGGSDGKDSVDSAGGKGRRERRARAGGQGD